MTNKTRTEKHIIKSSDNYFSLILSFCKLSKNLYNHANYLVRQEFIKTKKLIKYKDLDKILKADAEYPDYQNTPTAQSAQQILRLLDKNWKAFMVSIKDWSKHKEKYTGRPKLPKYLKKNSQVFQGFTVKPKFTDKENFVSFQQVRLIPHRNRIVAEVVYNIDVPELKSDNQRYIGIDIGVNNLATVCNNTGNKAFIINGKPLKSINQYYNKQISYYREVTKRMNKVDYSKQMDRLTEKRNSKIDDYLHKASRYIINYCVKNDIHTIVIGKNKEWKQNSKLSKKENQNFVQIPFARLIEMIQYKAEEKGIAVILTEESYTSGTSFIDGEAPVKENYNKARRIHRGLFVSNKGIKINADLNGAYQILKKVVPIKWDRGCVLHPFVVNVA